MRDDTPPWVLLGLLCWPLAMILHVVNDKHEAPRTYQLEVLDHGDVYVLGYDLSEDDCQKLREGYCREMDP